MFLHLPTASVRAGVNGKLIGTTNGVLNGNGAYTNCGQSTCWLLTSDNEFFPGGPFLDPVTLSVTRRRSPARSLLAAGLAGLGLAVTRTARGRGAPE